MSKTVHTAMNLTVQKTTHDTAIEMQRHYQEHGYFRSEDLKRVFGDPTTGVDLVATKSISGCHWIKI